MITDAYGATEAVVQTVGDALDAHFTEVLVLDDGFFRIQVELDDGSTCDVYVRVS